MERREGCDGSIMAALACLSVCCCAPGGTAARSNAAQASAPTNQTVAVAPAVGPTAVALEEDNGTTRVPVLINNAVLLKFTVDSGASDVTIPADVASTLVRSGTITRDDFIGYETFQLADGSTVPSAVFRIRSLKVGGLELRNVVASLSNQNGSLLLGQSFLSRVSSWSIDNQRHELLLGAPKPEQALPATVATAPIVAGDTANEQTAAPPTSASTSQGASTAQDDAKTRVLAYFAAWSGVDASPGAVRPFYAAVVKFYGTQLDIDSLMSEKQSFAARWPTRTYTVREPSLYSTCEDEHTCLVQGVVDWVDANPTSGRDSAGAAEFSFVLRDGLIVGENGKVISRG